MFDTFSSRFKTQLFTLFMTVLIMTIEEEEGDKVMVSESSFVDADDIRSKLPQNKVPTIIPKDDSIRNKMEAMQKRIDELKDKVKYEGELLNNKDTFFGQSIIYTKSLDSLCDVKSKDSLSHDSNSFDDKVCENEEHSDKSLYFSASSYSMCSLSSNSSDSTYCSFTKFVNNFMKNQDHKERLSLLQLHSKKQISLNMMKTSLLELESKCSDELKLVEKSLIHLKKLAEEFKVDPEEQHGGELLNPYKLKAVDFNSSGDSGSLRPLENVSFKCLPVRDGSKTKVELGKSQALVKYKLIDGPNQLNL